MKQFRQAVIVIFGLLLSCSVFAAQTTAQGLLQDLSNQMIKELNAKKLLLKTDSHHQIYAMVDRILLPHVDMDLMAKLILRRSWLSATPKQRELFKERLTNIIIGTYAQALASYTSEDVQFLPVRGGEAGREQVRIDSYIIRQGAPRIPVSYRLRKENGEWKAYDLIVEGVSLVQSYQSQFSSILQHGSMDQLLETMAKHNKAVGNPNETAASS